VRNDHILFRLFVFASMHT